MTWCNSLQLIVSSLFLRWILSFSILDYTLDQNRSYRDCLIDSTVNDASDDYLFYCLRTDEVFHTSSFNTCFTGDQITFKQLRENQIDGNDLLNWGIPLDLADFYASFINHSFSDDHQEFICNCSLANVFGRYCEYSVNEDMSNVDDLIHSSAEDKKKFYPEERLLTCYESLEPCLDYRDICDGEFDTIDGLDELFCDLIETHHCTNDQFRCRHGLCIDRTFLFDGQGDCNDFSDEQSLLLHTKYSNFEHCYKQSSFDCDEHWCDGREMISCGDGECIPWYQRFWNEHDCHNSYTHIHNCELEERHNRSILFSITDQQGRCRTNITQFIPTDDHCLLLIKCAVTLHPSCQSIDMPLNNYTDAIAYLYQFCQNRTKINYASGRKFLSPFVQIYYQSSQFKVTVELEFFALMNVRVPSLFCFIGERLCDGIQVIHNGSICVNYSEIYERKERYPFSPWDYLFCQLGDSHSSDDCTDSTSFYRCRTTGECISKHRLFDGFSDCLDLSDENDFNAFHSIESVFFKDRYNCTMDGKTSTAVMRHFLGDGISQCRDGTDEMSRSINWQQQRCLISNDYSCFLLRTLFNDTEEEHESIQIIRFSSLCDSIWDLREGADETDCNQWVCESGWSSQENNQSQRWSGNCIDPEWRCNHIWDSHDGSDEWNCNYTEEYPIPQCILLTTNEVIPWNESHTIAGNDLIDCLGGIDERMTFACQDGFPLNERFLCHDRLTCLQPILLCNHVKDCPTGEDESDDWCGIKHSLNTNLCQANRFACQERNDSGPCIPQEDRCHPERHSCLFSHLDDHMCIEPREYHLPSTVKTSPSPEIQQAPSNLIPSPWYCDRGLVVRRYGKLACLCPPSYYGYRCERHSHRLTVIFTFNQRTLKVELIRMIVLLINNKTTIDYIQLTQRPTFDRRKHRLYLNYPPYLYSHLRTMSTNSTVRFLIYAIDPHSVRLVMTVEYPIQFSFLPAARLAVALEYKESFISIDEQVNSSLCRCAPGSQCLMDLTCICLTDQYGPTCHLRAIACPVDLCQNGGRCLSWTDKFHRSHFQCLCSSETFGEHCEHQKALSVDFHDHQRRSSLTFVRLIQLMNYDRSHMKLRLKQQHRMMTTTERIVFKDLELPSVGLLKVYDETKINIYVLYFNQEYSNIFLTEKNQTRCLSTNELNLTPINDSLTALLLTMKRYHQPCSQDPSIMCFYDLNMYLCFCHQITRRAECYSYDFQSDHCDQCLNDGQCIQSEINGKTDQFCLCRSCYEGERCEISRRAFAFTLDTLMVKDSIDLQIIYLCLVSLLFLIGLLTNICSIVTFSRPSPRRFGVGNYLFVSAILNQISLLFLVMKILSILLGTMDIAHSFFCKTIAYFLSVTTRANYWLTTWTTIERLTIILFPTFTTFRKPHVAILIIIITLFIVCAMHIHEMLFYKVINHSSLCLPMFESSIISIYNRTTILFDHCVPFLVQIVTITLLIVMAARSRAKSVGRKMNFRQTLKKQFHTHKELYLTPSIIVLILSILPQSILSFSVACTELKQWQRYLLLIFYFLSYLPQTLGFIIQILPSTGYTMEFRDTSIGKLRFFKWLLTSRAKQKERQKIINIVMLTAKLNALIKEQSDQLHDNTIHLPPMSS